MHPTDAEQPIDPASVRIVASFPTVKAAQEAAARWPIAPEPNKVYAEPAKPKSFEERAAEEAAKYEDRPFKELNIRQQYAYINSVKSQDARKEKQAAEDAAEQRLVDIERRLTELERRTAPPSLPDMSGYL